MLVFQLCPHEATNPLVLCSNQKAPTCLTVPGIKPTIAGSLARVEQIEPNIPGYGFKLIYEEGEICEITKAPRRTIIKFPCNPTAQANPEQINPLKAFEGQKKEVCNYFVEFTYNRFGCPVQSNEEHSDTLSAELTKKKSPPQIWAVTGCENSTPLRTTSECQNMARIQLVIHGMNFDSFCSPPDEENLPHSPFNAGHCTSAFRRSHIMSIGGIKCLGVTLTSSFRMDCSIEKVTGKNLPVTINRVFTNGTKVVVAEMEEAVSFKETINYKEKFDKVVELGVGGLKKEIDELYRRAFASRSKSVSQHVRVWDMKWASTDGRHNI